MYVSISDSPAAIPVASREVDDSIGPSSGARDLASRIDCFQRGGILQSQFHSRGALAFLSSPQTPGSARTGHLSLSYSYFSTTNTTPPPPTTHNHHGI